MTYSNGSGVSGNYERRDDDDDRRGWGPPAKVKRRAEEIAQSEVGFKGDWGDYVAQAQGEASWDGFVAWMDRLGYQHKARYDYPAPGGAALYEVHRFQHRHVSTAKRFIPRHREGDDWAYGPGPVLVPYNLPDLLARPDDAILLVEGEKGVDFLKGKGLLASCMQGGHWSNDAAMFFAGRKVIVAMDHDDAGRDRTAKAREWLAKVGAEVKVPRFIGMKPGNGVDDWIEANGLDAYGDAVRAAKAERAIAHSPYTFPAVETIPLWDWLYGRFLLRKTVSGTAAAGGTGKSSKAIVEALAMASGKLLLGEQVRRPHRVLMINLEDNRNAMDKRIAAVMKHYSLTKEDIGDRFTVIAKGEIKLKLALQSRNGAERNEVAIRWLTDYLIENKIDVLSLDPFIKSHAINENNNNEVSVVIEALDDIAETADCAISLWHHTRKGGGNGATIESARGAMAFIDACRSVRILETMSKEEGSQLKIEKPSFYFRSFNGKRNFAPPTDQSDWYQIVTVDAGNGWPIGDEVGVVTRWQHPGAQAVEITPTKVSEIITKVGLEPVWREHPAADMWVGKAVGPILGLDPDDKATKKAIKKLINMGVLETKKAPDQKRTERMFVVATAPA